MGNGNGTVPWRVGALERRVDKKANLDDVKRIEAKVDKLIGWQFWVMLTLITATVTFSTTAILLIVQLTQRTV